MSEETDANMKISMN